MQIIQTPITFNNTITKFNIFDYQYYKQRYSDQGGPNGHIGLDIISYCLERDKCWEPFQTEITKEILETNPDGIFIDIGCHLGYYSVLASVIGNKVKSVDACEDFLHMFKDTIKANNLTNIEIFNTTVDENFKLSDIHYDDEKIALIKVDIEGFEDELVNSIECLLDKKKILNLILEISPKLNDKYPSICRKIHNHGYKIFDLGLSHQRPLINDTSHLSDLKKLKVDMDDIEAYISGLPYGQSNFLFTLE